MKAILEFDLNNEDDKVTYENTLNADKLFRLVEDWEDHLRKLDKYGEYKTEAESNLVHEIRVKWFEMKAEGGILGD